MRYSFERPTRSYSAANEFAMHGGTRSSAAFLMRCGIHGRFPALGAGRSTPGWMEPGVALVRALPWRSFRRCRLVLLGALTGVFLLSVVRAEAAFASLPGVEDHEEEKIAAQLRVEGELSAAERQRVGRERYEQRLALKAALAQSMKAGLEGYRTRIGRSPRPSTNQSSGTPAAAATEGRPAWAWVPPMVLMLGLGILALARVRSRESSAVSLPTRS